MHMLFELDKDLSPKIGTDLRVDGRVVGRIVSCQKTESGYEATAEYFDKDICKSIMDGMTNVTMGTQVPKCAGCGRPEIHKMCPAWGTPKYMTGELFTEEDEKTYAAERQAAIEKARNGPCCID